VREGEVEEKDRNDGVRILIRDNGHDFV